MSLTFNRKSYPSIHLVSQPSGRFIRKHISIKERLFYSAVQSFSFLLLPERNENEESYAFYRYFPQGNIAHCSKKFFVQAIEAIAVFHGTALLSNFYFLPSSLSSREGELEQIEQLLIQKDVPIVWSRFEDVKAELTSISKDYAAVCHGDFIALNIVRSRGNIKIIDWEHACIDFAETDVGRFLGDLFYREPSFKHRYYDFSWHDELVWKYLMARKTIQPEYKFEPAIRRIFLGELWNYLGPIHRCLEHGDRSSRWFLENVFAFNNAMPVKSQFH